MLQKMVGAFYTILSLNYSCEDIIQGIKLNYQESWKKRGGSSIQNSLIIAIKILEFKNYRGEFLNEIISFSCKDITRAIKTMD